MEYKTGHLTVLYGTYIWHNYFYSEISFRTVQSWQYGVVYNFIVWLVMNTLLLCPLDVSIHPFVHLFRLHTEDNLIIVRQVQ
jgi:hypothetical protein